MWATIRLSSAPSVYCYCACDCYLWTDRPSAAERVLPAPARASDRLSTREAKPDLKNRPRTRGLWEKEGECVKAKQSLPLNIKQELKHLPFFALPVAIFCFFFLIWCRWGDLLNSMNRPSNGLCWGPQSWDGCEGVSHLIQQPVNKPDGARKAGKSTGEWWVMGQNEDNHER